MALAAGILFLLIAALVGIRLTDAFVFALGVAVALVPDGPSPHGQAVACLGRVANGRTERAGKETGGG